MHRQSNFCILTQKLRGSSAYFCFCRFLPKTKALYVEGAFRVWLRDSQVNYFLLRGEPVPRPPAPEGTADDVADIRVWTAGERHAGDLVKLPNVHEQVRGFYL